jgi:hypothetical protein
MMASYVASYIAFITDSSGGIRIHNESFGLSFKDWIKINVQIGVSLAVIFWAFNVSLTKLWRPIK